MKSSFKDTRSIAILTILALCITSCGIKPKHLTPNAENQPTTHDGSYPRTYPRR